MKTQERLDLDDDKYGLLFAVGRSIRYHSSRMAFYEILHKITNFVTVLMAGSFLFDIGRTGEAHNMWWLTTISVFAALLAVADMVLEYGKMASLHSRLRGKFADLEMDMLAGTLDELVWNGYRIRRIQIEKEEPPVYVVLDVYCDIAHTRALGAAQRVDVQKIPFWMSLTRNLFRWEGWTPPVQTPA